MNVAEENNYVYLKLTRLEYTALYHALGCSMLGENFDGYLNFVRGMTDRVLRTAIVETLSDLSSNSAWSTSRVLGGS